MMKMIVILLGLENLKVGLIWIPGNEELSLDIFIPYSISLITSSYGSGNKSAKEFSANMLFLA